LTAENGTWTNSPTSFAYQWQRCDAGGANCADISGAKSKTYDVVAGDAEKTLRVVVTATNADGSTSANSRATAIVSSSKSPTNTALPTISGTAQVGEELTADNGTWTGGVTSYAYQWQRCDAAGGSCAGIANATARVYGVRTIDAGNTLRVAVIAKNASGSSSATSGATKVVTTVGGSTTVVTVKGNRAPTISFVSLKRVGVRVYAGFRACDDGSKAITVVARDTKARTLAISHGFSVTPRPCRTQSRNWLLAARFRHGRYTATLRAIDKSGASSRTVSRSLTFR
jgi:hypothetical protein